MDDFHPNNPNAQKIFDELIKHLKLDQIIMIGVLKSKDVIVELNGTGVLGIAGKKSADNYKYMTGIMEVHRKIMQEGAARILNLNSYKP